MNKSVLLTITLCLMTSFASAEFSRAEFNSEQSSFCPSVFGKSTSTKIVFYRLGNLLAPVEVHSGTFWRPGKSISYQVESIKDLFSNFSDVRVTYTESRDGLKNITLDGPERSVREMICFVVVKHGEHFQQRQDDINALIDYHLQRLH